MGNRSAMTKQAQDGTVAQWYKYVYNDSNQLVKEELYDGKKTTTLTYTYDGDGNRVFQLNYNLHTDEDRKGNSGNGNGNNKDNKGSDNNGKGSSSNSKGNSKSEGTDDAGYGNATNAEANNSQNQSGILFPIDSEVSTTEQSLIDKIKTTGKQKNYELMEYINDVNRAYAEVLVEQNINGKTDTSYIYGVDRLSMDRFDGSTGYYLYDPRGSVSGITNEEGQIYQSYRYSVTGEITFGAPQYENEYTYNGESYNPNIKSQYLRARYYDVVTAVFLTEDSYLGDINEPLTLNRYNYCVSSYLNYQDPSGHDIGEVLHSVKNFVESKWNSVKTKWNSFWKSLGFGKQEKPISIEDLAESLESSESGDEVVDFSSDNEDYLHQQEENAGKNNNYDQCEIESIGFTDSTKQFIIKYEGEPFLTPRINSDNSITIGYGYDFTESEDSATFNKYLTKDSVGNIKVKASMTIEEAEETIKWAADKKRITQGLETFIQGTGKGNEETSLILNQNQYDALFSYFYANGPSVFTDTKYNEWMSYGGEYAIRAQAREELRNYLIEYNGNYDSQKIVELFVESKGANIKYEYKDRRTAEAELFNSPQN